MRIPSIKRSTLATIPALSMFLLFQACGSGGNADADQPAAPDPVVGVWEGVVHIRDCTTQAEITNFVGAQVFHQGGTMSDTNNSPTASRGPGWGTWSRNGDTYTAKFRFFTYDATGAKSGAMRVTRTFTLSADGNTATATSANQQEDVNGVVTRRGCSADANTKAL
ncbi:hypothetical protein BH10PSE17_BH10PSE17_12480 [soil metagenome]